MITPQLHTENFTQADVDEFQRLMTALLTTCRSIADEHSPDGSWTPTNPDLFDQFDESMQLIATVSRALNSTRRGIRRIDNRARRRLYERKAAQASHSRPTCQRATPHTDGVTSATPHRSDIPGQRAAVPAHQAVSEGSRDNLAGESFRPVWGGVI
ncbi:hypothetical protein ACPF8X_02270 [Streptomyces sp. G35A]